MKDHAVLDIADLCLAIEEKASDLYARLANASEDEAPRHFWREMTDTEKRHIDFWRNVKTMAEERPLPDIFDDPIPIRDEVARLLQRALALSGQWEASGSNHDALILAFRLEFAMAHPAFALFYQTLGPLAGAENPDDDYRSHVNRFAKMVAWYGQETAELELLGEALEDLWDSNRTLTRLVTLDSLTGLLNRHGFFVYARQLASLAQRNGNGVAVLIVDIDDLSEINDEHGHPRGDQVLQGVAEVLRANIRRSDIVARYGGGEFIALLLAVQPDAVGPLAEQLRYQIEIARPAGMPITVSIGAAQGKILFDPDTELDPLIAKANRGLALAKTTGRNRVAYRE